MQLQHMTRRELLRTLSAAGLGSAFATRAIADAAGDTPGASGKIKELTPMTPTARALYPARLVNGKVIQPERPLPIFAETDVLVVGGGPAGFAAAVSAARAGAKTMLMERYGYFGGLWAGGIVLYVENTHIQENGEKIKVLRGIGDELLERLTKIEGAIINQAPGKHNPTTDPEATKFMMDEMVAGAGVNVVLHSWATDVVMEGNAVRGVVFESKSGRQAILAKVVVDATGDGDVFAAGGAAFEQRLHAIGMVHRLGNVDRADMTQLKAAGFKSLGSAEPLSSVRWVNLRGPSTDGLDVKELSRLELEHRRAIWKRVQTLRNTPGGDKLFLLQTAPQLGVRTTRLLAGVAQLTAADAKAGKKFTDVVGVGGSQGANQGGWPIPYGALVPQKLDGLIAAGRCISCDDKWIEDMRLIAACLITGHAAGAAAAVSVQSQCQPRAVEVAKVQDLLRKQGAYLG
jgi:ribulose 1,5-bisphosphate synthetase/thiazole synthase